MKLAVPVQIVYHIVSYRLQRYDHTCRTCLTEQKMIISLFLFSFGDCICRRYKCDWCIRVSINREENDHFSRHITDGMSLNLF